MPAKLPSPRRKPGGAPGAFSTKLIRWYERHKRDLPWRHTRDPWRILVSEVMLQQTRAAAVIPYYEKFLAKYPQPEDFAQASESDVLAMWAGLGYYSRARNLQKAAQAMGGEFPQTYDAIRALPGVGDYTAAAVASFAFGLPHAVLDGNVLRVLTRVTNDASDIGAPSTRRRIQAAAAERLDRSQPNAFNQAIMELGATLCLPKKPQCLLCPVSDHCDSRKAGREAELPVKLKKGVKIDEERTLLLIEQDGRLLLSKRTADEPRMPGFYDLPDAAALTTEKGRTLGSFSHAIVNHSYTFYLRLAPAPAALPGGEWLWVSWTELGDLPLSTTARKALKLFQSEQSGKNSVPGIVTKLS